MITLSDGRQAYMSPDDDTKDSFLSWVKAQKKRLYVADYSFNLPELVDLLIQKFQQGVDVKLVLDSSQAKGVSEKPEVGKILQAGIPTAIGTSSKHKIMHMKYTVGDTSCQYGSWNYTVAASDEDNFFIIDNYPVITNWFLQIHGEMYDYIKANQKNNHAN